MDDTRRVVLQLADVAWKGVVVGIAAGLGAAAFRALIAFFHNLAFLGHVSFRYVATRHTPAAPWGIFIVLVPVAGAVIVAFLVKNFAPQARGTGVPEVMAAVFYDRGYIRPVVGLVKAIASAVSIGTGAAVGREGPITQIAATFASALGKRLKVPVWQRAALMAAGAGAGIAATFNTPIGGIFFATELMLAEVSARTMVPVVLASAAATLIGRVIFGMPPTFTVPHIASRVDVVFGAKFFLLYAFFGVVIGLAAALTARSIYWFEDVFDRVSSSYYLRHMAGMFVVGWAMYAFMRGSGAYWIQGVGYAAVHDILRGALTGWSFLLLLFAAKLLVTGIALGSGASGGIFSPTLFLGAALGQCFGVVITTWMPAPTGTPQAFALAGMAAMVGGTTGAVMTAVAMIFEMTGDYAIVVPIAICVIVASATRWALLRQSIYTMKSMRRGRPLPHGTVSEFTLVTPIAQLADVETVTVPGDTTVCTALADHPEAHFFRLTGQEEDRLRIVDRSLASAAASDETTTLQDIAHDAIRLSTTTRLRDALTSMRDQSANYAVIMREDGKSGVVTHEALLRRLEGFLELT